MSNPSTSAAPAPEPGPGILDGLDVLDLSWGIAGPDDGDAPGRSRCPRDPDRAPGRRSVRRDLSGSRGVAARQATSDPRSPRGRRPRRVPRAGPPRGRRDRELRARESPRRSGSITQTLLAANPRLVHCSITGYGETGKHAHRPAYDALVAARTGQQFESRGSVGTTIGRLAHAEILPGYEAPDGCMIGAPRSGPLFSGLPWISIATFYNASVAINAALVAREITGCGQHVHTSMLQGVLATTVGRLAAGRARRPAGLQLVGLRSARAEGVLPGLGRSLDPPLAARCRAFILNAAELDTLEPASSSPRRATRPACVLPIARRDARPPRVLRPHARRRSQVPRRRLGPARRGARGSRSSPSGRRKRRWSIPSSNATAAWSRSTACAWSVTSTDSRRSPAPPIRGTACAGEHTDEVRTEAAAEPSDAPVAPRPRPADRVAARRHRRARSRPGRRRPVRHPAPRRPRRDGHQGQQRGHGRLLPPDVLRDVVQPRQAEHRDRPQASRRARRAPRPRARRRRGAAQHALRRRGTTRRRLQVARAPEPVPDLLPHPRSRHEPRAAARQRPDRARRSRARRGWRAASKPATCRSGRTSRSATPATATSRRSPSSRRSPIASARARASSSTRRSSTRTS